MEVIEVIGGGGVLLALCLLVTAPLAAIQHGRGRAADGVISSLFVAALAVPFVLAAAVVA